MRRILIRDTDDYDRIINEIGEILHKNKLTYVEAYGVLECVKDNLSTVEE